MLVDARGNALSPDPSGAPSEENPYRSDAWENPLTGIGTLEDKTTAGRFGGVRRITDRELTNLYNGSALAAKVVGKRPIEMFRRGYALECNDVDASAAQDLHEHAVEELHADDEFLKATTFGRLYGGGVLVLGIDDGGLPSDPLDESRIRNFTFLNWVDRRYCYVLDYYTDPSAPKFGQPQHYVTSNTLVSTDYAFARQPIQKRSTAEIVRSGGSLSVIHESRVIRFDGVATDDETMKSLAGWTWSVLQRVYDEMRKFEHSFDSVEYLLADASQAVFTMKGLISAISSKQRGAIQMRASMIEEIRSVIHAIMVDADGEKYERAATPFGGIADLLDKMMLKFAAACDMPVTELFGRAPAGMNATGESDTRKWYDTIASEQSNNLAPLQRRFYRLLSLSADCPVKLPAGKGGKPLKWKIKYHPLTAPTDDEKAKTDLAIAQRDQIYLAEGVVTPEEVALDRQELYPSMDVEARETAMKAAQTFDPYENDPEPPPPPMPGAPGVPPVPGAPKGPPPLPGKPAAPALPPKTGAPGKKPGAKGKPR